MSRGRRNSSFISQSLIVIVGALFVFAGGCSNSSSNGSNPWPSEATLTAVSISSGPLYTGAAATLTATVESRYYEEDLQVDFYLVPASEITNACSQPYTLPSWHVELPEIAQSGPDAPPISIFQQRFVSSLVEYTPNTGNRQVSVTQNMTVAGLPAGSYYLVASIAGKSGCVSSAAAVTISEPTAPDLLHAKTSLNNNSFRMPSYNPRQGAGRTPPAFVISSEIANNGLAVEDPVEVGFSIIINGKTLPLEVEVRDDDGLPVKEDRYTFNPRSGSLTAATIEQRDVRGVNFRIYLSDEALTELAMMSADTACTLLATIDPDGKIQEISTGNNTVSLPVMFLAGDCNCTPTDPTTPQSIFCFGPTGSPYNESWTSSFLYAGYQFGGSSTDPAYFAYNLIDDVPTAAHFHVDSWVRIGFSESEYCSPLNATIDLQYHFPPVPDGSEYTLAEFSCNFEILGDTILNGDDTISIASETDFSFFKVEKKWVLYKDTVIVGDIVPVTFKMGIEGDIGLGGTADYTADASQNATLNLTIGPDASLGAFGEAMVDLVVAEVGVEVDLTVIDVNLAFAPYVRFYAPPAGDTQGAVEFGASAPLNLGEGAGEFDLIVKVPLVGKWDTTIVSWDGWTQTYNMMTPLKYFYGPINEFFTTLNDGTTGTPTGAVYSTTPPSSNGVTEWQGDIKLNEGTYTFYYQNVNGVSLTPEGSSTPSHTSSGACNGNGSVSWTISTAGTYELDVTTSTSCYQTGYQPAYVYWIEEGYSAIGGLSGRSGNTGGSPSGAIARWYFNSDPSSSSVAAAMYTNDTDVKLQSLYSAVLNTEPNVNSPAQGVWVRWVGALQLDLTQTGAALLFTGNPPTTQSGCSATIQDTISVSIGTTPGGSDILTSTSVSIGANGQAIVNVPQSATSGPYYYTINYHPAYSGDYAGCSSIQANDANIQMAVYADGNWWVNDVCTNLGSVSTNLLLQDGPGSDASIGTLEGGSLTSTSPCSGISTSAGSIQEYAAGAFYFGEAGDFDFFVGSSTDQSYQLWIDGQLVASRIVTNPSDPTQNPSTACCVANGNLCPTRESTFVQNLSAGYHFIEGYFTANNGGYTQIQSENRIRWSPRNANEALVYIYGSQTELNNVLYEPSQGAGTPYPTVEPLLVFKDSGQFPWGASALNMEWTSANDCDVATNYQFSCENSLQEAEYQSGTVMGFSALWDGYYNFTDQTLYTFNISSNRLNADFWLDGQQYSQMLGTSAGAYNAFPLYNFYSVLLNAKSPNGELNHLRLAMGGVPQKAASVQFASSWTTVAANSYQVNFLDTNGNLISSATDTYGSGETQSMCIGSGCSAITSIPSNTCRIVIVASPVGDVQGLYNSGTSMIDLIATLTDSNTSSTQLADVCINGQCVTGTKISTGSSVVFDSSNFVTYVNNPTTPTSNQGLFSQQTNAVVITIRGNAAAGNPPYTADCLSSTLASGQKFTVTLSYQQH